MPSLFPEDTKFENNNIESAEEPLEFKGSYLFDSEKGEFIKNPDGTIARADDLQAYIQWCNKAMASPRYKLAYSDLFGHDFEELIGNNLSRDAIELEIKRMTKETLMAHPRTKEVDNFVFQWSDTKEEIYYTYEVSTIDDNNFELEKVLKAR